MILLNFDSILLANEIRQLKETSADNLSEASSA